MSCRSYNSQGDLASDGDTVCDSILCNHNYHVSDHKCVVCAPGTYNDEGDDASGPDTSCDIIECAENEYVSNHICQACPTGTYNAVGDLQVVLTQFVIVSYVVKITVLKTMNV